MLRHLALAFALLVSCTQAQTANQWLFQKKNTGAGFTAYGVTPILGRAFGIDGSGNPAMLSISGGSGLENILSSVTGDTLTFTGTLTAPRILTFRDLAGTVALTSDLSSYLTTAAAASAYQPLDSDLTAISALTTTTHGRSLLTGADAAASRSALGLGTLATQSATISDYLTTASAATTYQPLDSDLTSIAALTTTTHGRSLLTGANAAASRSTLGLGTLATQNGTISDYLTTAAAASTYAAISGAAFTGTVNAANGLSTPVLQLAGAGEISYEHASAGGTVTSKLILNADPSTEREAVTWYLRHDLGGTIAYLSDLTSLNGSNITSGTVAIANGGTGATTAGNARIALLPSMTGNGGKFLRVNAGATDYELATVSGGGDALTSGTLGQFAATTSAQLRGVLSDESGTGEILTTNGSAASLTSFPTLNQNTTGNAATATALQTGRAINGVTFDGTAAITVPAAAGTLTGATLASGVTASSLTSVGTIATGTWQGTAIADAYVASASTWNAKESALTFGTGLTRTTNTVTVNTSQNIATLSNLTGNGFVKTSGGTGALSVDTNTYLTSTGNGSSLTGITQSQITGTVALANGGTGVSLTDPNADRLLFWDDSAGTMAWLTAGSGLTITGTTITASGGGGGAAPQPLQVKKTDTFSRSASGFGAVTGLSQAYTPTSTTQKVLVRALLYVGVSSNASFVLGRLTRNGAVIDQGDSRGSRTRTHGAVYNNSIDAWQAVLEVESLDTPGTTSEVTYAVEISNSNGSATVYVNRTQLDQDLAIYPSPVSTLTVIPFAE